MNHLRSSRALLLSTAILIGGLGVACSDDGGDDAVDTGTDQTTDDPGTTDEPGTTGATDDVQEPLEGDQTVLIANYAFDPDAITVKAGSKVTWTNNDDFEHTATSGDGSPAAFDTGDLGTDGSGEYTFEEPGTYEYKCDIHTYMEGTVDVVE